MARDRAVRPCRELPGVLRRRRDRGLRVRSASGVALILGKTAFGTLADRFSTYRCNRWFGALAVAGLALLCLSGRSEALLLGATCLYGLGLSTTTVDLTAWAGDLSDAGAYDATVQRFQTGYALGSFAFSTMPGLLADAFDGLYVPAYLLFCACAAFVLLAVQHVYRRHGAHVGTMRVPAGVAAEPAAARS